MQHPARTELWAILRLAGPLIASQLAHMLMVLTDTLMMARLSPEALAGGGLGAATYSFVSIFCIGVIAAVGTLVAIRQGAGDIEGAARLTQAGLWLAWLMALVAGLLLWNLKPVLLLFGQTETNVQSAGQFLLILPFALPGYLSFMALRGFTSAIGRATPVMVISLAGTVANFLLNYALITGMFGLPKLGLVGIGLVTAIVANCMALALAWHIKRHPAYAAYPLRQGWRGPIASICRSSGAWACPSAAPTRWKSGCSPSPRCAWAPWAAPNWRRTRSPCRSFPWPSWCRPGSPTRSPCASASTTVPGSCCTRVWPAGSGSPLAARPCWVSPWSSGCCRTS